MRNIIVVFIVLLAITSCKNDKKDAAVAPEDAVNSSINDGTTIVRGEFIYFEDVAVLTTNSEIYEVVQDAKMQQLKQQAQKLKKSKTDMVTTTLKVVVVTNPKRAKTADVWEKAIEIKDIMEVKAATSSTTINIK